MQVRNVEGLANRNGPESCVGVGDCAGEALTGERVGRVLSREIHETSGVPTLWEEAEGHIQRAANARRSGTPRGRRPRARAEAPRTGIGRSRGPWRRGASPSASGVKRRTPMMDDREKSDRLGHHPKVIRTSGAEGGRRTHTELSPGCSIPDTVLAARNLDRLL